MESGQLVLVTLQNPQDKFWSLMLSLDPAAVNVRAVDLRCQDDFTLLVKSGDAVSATVEFLPVHRGQRIEEDDRNGELPSVSSQHGRRRPQILRGTA